MGDEAAAIVGYMQPELLIDILSTMSDTVFKILDQVSREIAIDVLFVHEDMAGKTGPMWGPELIDEYMQPYYSRVWHMLQEKGSRLFDMDTDGNFEPILPNLIKAGVNCIHPVEPAAGMDMVKLRQTFGQEIAFVGGMDKYALCKSRDDIENEVMYKTSHLKNECGIMFGLDHRIPAEVTLENYHYYHRRMSEELGI